MDRAPPTLAAAAVPAQVVQASPNRSTSNDTLAKTLVSAHDSVSAKGIARDIILHAGRRASLALHIHIVGCGLGGLAAAFALAKAGHRITIIESAPAIGEVGAGIQVTPNLSRLLIRWGLKDKLESIAVRPDAIVFRRYSTGEKVGYTQWRTMEADYGAPYYHIHRADFHRLLFDLVQDTENVTLKLDSTVTTLNPIPNENHKVSLTLQSGEVIESDLIIGADGVKSMIREVVVGRPTAATPTGDAAYRALIPTSKLLADPELRPFVETPEMTAWMAPRRHLMAYCIRAKEEYNIVLLHPDDGSVESWTAEGSAEKMRKDFADFEPRIQKLLSIVSSTLKWRLMDREALETWIHPLSRVVLLGDACHPMLPYRAQGAAMAVEDGAVLGNLFSRLESRAQIAGMLKAYQDLRLERTTETMLSSRLNQKIFHLPDGPEQQARDAVMRAAILNPDMDHEGNQNQWADKRKNLSQFGYDADAEAERWWREVGERELGPLGRSSSQMNVTGEGDHDCDTRTSNQQTVFVKSRL